MLSELLAATIVRHSMSLTEEFRRDSDVNLLFASFDTKMTKLAGRLQRALVDSKELSALTKP